MTSGLKTLVANWRAVAVALGTVLTLTSAVAGTEQWPQFRATEAGDVADDPRLPESWSETENVAWETEIPGVGWSSPVVWGVQSFRTSTISPTAEPRAIKGLYDPGDEDGKTRSTSEHRWMA
jgi:hypothetical protein